MLKDEIFKQIKIDPERQRLIFQGKQLKDHELIEFHKIKDDQVIHMVARQNQPPA